MRYAGMPAHEFADQRERSTETVLIKCHSRRAREKMLRLVGRERAQAFYSLRREVGKGAYRIPAEFETAAKAIKGVTGMRDGEDLHPCWPSLDEIRPRFTS